MSIKQKVIRKILTGNWESFKFDVKSKSFCVKNFSASPVYVSFEDGDDTDNSIKIREYMAEICYITSLYDLAGTFFKDTIYVKGTGEVEVEAIEWQ